MPESLPPDTLHFPPAQQLLLDPHLPPQPKPKSQDQTQNQDQNAASKTSPPEYPFTTLTFATSLDSSLSLSPGTQTLLSGPASKSMTHYLRSRHDAILIGVGTAVADDPGLNCRIAGVAGYGAAAGDELFGQPRPVVLDPRGRWGFSSRSRVFRTAAEGRGRGPWIVCFEGVQVGEEKRRDLEAVGGKVIFVEKREGRERMEWRDVLKALKREGIQSVMVEGGGEVINSLLGEENLELVDSVIVTLAPTWLGRGGVVVSPPRRTDGEGKAVAAVRLGEVEWLPLGEDVVLCGKVRR
ncbi:dihydrofolate reductase-like domain-containing protein [Xylogone sp. PMI_703]|nr:dihydrofolate reductase-like domain-containing protein [Xylogone sp. PMI_703]